MKLELRISCEKLLLSESNSPYQVVPTGSNNSTLFCFQHSMRAYIDREFVQLQRISTSAAIMGNKSEKCKVYFFPQNQEEYRKFQQLQQAKSTSASSNAQDPLEYYCETSLQPNSAQCQSQIIDEGYVGQQNPSFQMSTGPILPTSFASAPVELGTNVSNDVPILPDDLEGIDISSILNDQNLSLPQTAQSNFGLSSSELLELQGPMQQVRISAGGSVPNSFSSDVQMTPSPGPCSSVSPMSENAKSKVFDEFCGQKEALKRSSLGSSEMKKLISEFESEHMKLLSNQQMSRIKCVKLVVHAKLDRRNASVVFCHEVDGARYPGGFQILSHVEDKTCQPNLTDHTRFCPPEGYFMTVVSRLLCSS